MLRFFRCFVCRTPPEDVIPRQDSMPLEDKVITEVARRLGKYKAFMVDLWETDEDHCELVAHQV